jgi:hypothetical protein
MAYFKNITYVEMMTEKLIINVCYKTALECEETALNNNTREHCE